MGELLKKSTYQKKAQNHLCCHRVIVGVQLDHISSNDSYLKSTVETKSKADTTK